MRNKKGKYNTILVRVPACLDLAAAEVNGSGCSHATSSLKLSKLKFHRRACSITRNIDTSNKK